MNNKVYRDNKNLIKAAIVICITFIFIYLIINYKKYFININIKNLRNYILSFGSISFLVLLLIYSLKPVVIFFPAALLTILAGNIYGPLKGFTITILGLFLSGSLAFYISKNLGQAFVSKITRGEFMKLDKNIKEHGLKIIFMMRISTVFPYDALSYAAGLTNINYKDFILGSLLGTCPEMLAYSYLGKNADHPFSRKFLYPLVIVFLIGLIGTFIYKSYNKIHK